MNLSNSSSDQAVKSQANPNRHVAPEENVPLMSMPFAVPFSGLTSLPIALCPLSGCSNIANTTGQAAAGLMHQSGLVLLNVPGSNPALTGIPQLMTCNQMAQPLPSSGGTEQSASSAPMTQLTSLPLQSQVSHNISSPSQVFSSYNTISMQPPVIQPNSPAAYMLVPIHQIPNNQSIVQQQNLPISTSNVNSNQPMAVQVSENQTTLSNHVAAPQAVIPNMKSSRTLGASSPTISSASSAMLPSVSTTVSFPENSSSSLSTCPNPINDPHISSSVQAADTDELSTSVTLLEENRLLGESALDQSLHSLPTTSGAENFQRESTSETTSGLVISEVSTSQISSTSSQDGTSNPPVKVAEKRKKGPAPKLDGNELCLICTDKASGFHYGVLSCEGCKGFFRRCITKNVAYQCKKNDQCEMDTYMRRKCQACRFRRCKEAGMKDDNVFESHGGSRAKKMKRESAESNSSPFVLSDPTLASERLPALTPRQRNVVEMLQANENRYQWPIQEDVDKVTPWIEGGDSHRCRTARFAHFTELAILIVQLVVEFTKQLPGFLNVSREDQIVLLKACTMEVMLLRAAKQYDKKTKSINFLNGKYYNKSSFYRAGMQVEFVDPIFDFCKSMAKLGLDEAEYALLVAINTFSTDRPNLKDQSKIEAVQDSYVELLRVYLKIHHPSDPLMFPRALMKLVELRTLNYHHSEQMFALKVQDKQLPPLLAEIWDM